MQQVNTSSILKRDVKQGKIVSFYCSTDNTVFSSVFSHVLKLYFMLILCTFVNTVSIVPKCSISGQHQARSSGCGASKHEDKLGTRHLHYKEERKNIERIENRKNG